MIRDTNELQQQQPTKKVCYVSTYNQNRCRKRAKHTLNYMKRWQPGFANDYILGFRLNSPWIIHSVFVPVFHKQCVIFVQRLLAIVMIAWTFTQRKFRGSFSWISFHADQCNCCLLILFVVLCCLLCVLVRLHDAKYTHYGSFCRNFRLYHCRNYFVDDDVSLRFSQMLNFEPDSTM